MEKGLRECCRSICIGKILIAKNEETHRSAEVMYVNFPVDISRRKVLLMSPVLSELRFYIYCYYYSVISVYQQHQQQW